MRVVHCLLKEGCSGPNSESVHIFLWACSFCVMHSDPLLLDTDRLKTLRTSCRTNNFFIKQCLYIPENFLYNRFLVWWKYLLHLHFEQDNTYPFSIIFNLYLEDLSAVVQLLCKCLLVHLGLGRVGCWEECKVCNRLIFQSSRGCTFLTIFS